MTSCPSDHEVLRAPEVVRPRKRKSAGSPPEAIAQRQRERTPPKPPPVAVPETERMPRKEPSSSKAISRAKTTRAKPAAPPVHGEALDKGWWWVLAVAVGLGWYIWAALQFDEPSRAIPNASPRSSAARPFKPEGRQAGPSAALSSKDFGSTADMANGPGAQHPQSDQYSQTPPPRLQTRLQSPPTPTSEAPTARRVGTPRLSARTNMELERRTGALEVSIAAVAADGKRHPLSDSALLTLKARETYLTMATNANPPVLWQDVPVGEYQLTAEVNGYAHTAPTQINVHPEETAKGTVILKPKASYVRFLVTPSTLRPHIYCGDRYIGLAPGPLPLDPLVPHSLTIRAPGWRLQHRRVLLPRPGRYFRCPVVMERVRAGLSVAVQTTGSRQPRTCRLQIGDTRPFSTVLPYESSHIPLEGPASIVLYVHGYEGDTTQRVVLKHGEMTYVVFEIEETAAPLPSEPSWAGRTFRKLTGVFSSGDE